MNEKVCNHRDRPGVPQKGEASILMGFGLSLDIGFGETVESIVEREAQTPLSLAHVGESALGFSGLLIVTVSPLTNTEKGDFSTIPKKPRADSQT